MVNPGKLLLPNVTFLMLETRRIELALEVLKQTTDHIQFGAVKFLSSPSIPDAQTKLEWEKQLWELAPLYVQTSHCLFAEWDAGINCVDAWSDEFLEYDYIGAPWPHEHYRVGNGGFSLRSAKLMRHLRSNPKVYPVVSPSDHYLCIIYRNALERDGFKFAPYEIGKRFSFERDLTSLYTFGFHGMFNWPRVLNEQQLTRRLNLAKKDEYIVQTMMPEFTEMWVDNSQATEFKFRVRDD